MNDQQIVRGVARRDETAIRCAMDKYGRLLWSVAASVLGHEAPTADIEECVADVFIYFWQHAEAFDPGRGNLKTWLAVVARSRAVDRRRQLLRREEVSLDQERLAESLQREEGLDAETREALCRAVDALEERDREILLRRFAWGQKPREIALALGLPVKQVENRLYRSKQKLRAWMSQ